MEWEERMLAVYEALKASYDVPNSKVLCNYIGNVSQEIVVSVVSMIEMQLEQSGESRGVTKKVCSAAIEAIQNIIHHSADNDTGFRSGIVMAGIAGNDYEVTTCNLVRNDLKTQVNKTFKSVMNVKRKKLLAMYKKSFNKLGGSSNSSAGIGTILMALACDGQIDYSFDPIDDKYFLLKVTCTI